MLKTPLHLLHLLRIYRTLAAHDALFFLEHVRGGGFIIFLGKMFGVRKQSGRPGQRLCRALEKLGPSFIKLGQALSIRADMVGEEVARDLANLQDNVPPFPFATAKATLEETLGQPLSALFQQFDEQPIAAASISQVHFAEDHAGRALAVKILRPNVERQFARDVQTIRWIATSLNRVDRLKRLRLPEVVNEFEKTVKLEMDFRLEAAGASELRENLAQDADIQVPEVIWSHTGQRVLTLERIYGINVDDVEALKKAGHNPDDILAKASRVFFQQVYRDGFFHADMHPGNVFVGADGRIIVVDFGIMGRIDSRTRLFLAEMLLAFLNRDYRTVSDIHFRAGYIPANQDPELFAQACRSIGEPVFGRPQSEISIATLLAQLFKVTEDFQMETQPQLLLLQKTMMLAEGIGRTLNPHVNFWELSRPLMEQWARQHFGPKGRAEMLASRTKDGIKKLEMACNALEHLPNIITKHGIRLHPETLAQNRSSTARWWFALAGLAGGLVLARLLQG